MSPSCPTIHTVSLIKSLWGFICHHQNPADAGRYKLKPAITFEVAVQFAGVWVLLHMSIPILYNILNVTSENYIQVENVFYSYTLHTPLQFPPLSEDGPRMESCDNTSKCLWENSKETRIFQPQFL